VGADIKEMPVKRSLLGAFGFVAVVVAVVGCRGQMIPQGAGGAQVAVPLPFEAKFETANDFYGRFDFGYSGIGPLGPGGGITHFHGDHGVSCGGPTTDRDVAFGGTQSAIDFSQLFWYCAPGGDPTKGHMMTGLTTTGYNHLWFSPKPEFTGISKVCWDINETFEGGKWTEVQFVDHADAVRYPVGTVTAGGNSVARGTGGFDLGYTDPEFRDTTGPSNGLLPASGNLAGLKIGIGSIFDWWQDQNTVMAQGVGWPGLLPNQGGSGPITDKAARYTTCIENAPNNQITITNNRPDGPRTYTIPGQIPQDARRVVFHDAEYDGPKRDGYSPATLTWHWDNIQVFAGAATVMPAPPSIDLRAPVRVPPDAAVPASNASAVPRSAGSPAAEVEPSRGAAIAAANVVGFGVTVAALALAVLLWPTRRRAD
jgi:hypothetical protein